MVVAVHFRTLVRSLRKAMRRLDPFLILTAFALLLGSLCSCDRPYNCQVECSTPGGAAAGIGKYVVVSASDFQQAVASCQQQAQNQNLCPADQVVAGCGCTVSSAD